MWPLAAWLQYVANTSEPSSINCCLNVILILVRTQSLQKCQKYSIYESTKLNGTLMNSMEQHLCLEVCGYSASEEILILSLLYSQRLYHKTVTWATWIHSKPTHYITPKYANTVRLPSLQLGNLIVKNLAITKYENWLSYKLWCTDTYWQQWEFLIVKLFITGGWYEVELHTGKHNYFQLDKLSHLTFHWSANDFTGFSNMVSVLQTYGCRCKFRNIYIYPKRTIWMYSNLQVMNFHL